MRATLSPLKGKYYGTHIYLEDDAGMEVRLEIWDTSERVPSERELECTVEQWKRNAWLPDVVNQETGEKGVHAKESFEICDDHFETDRSYRQACAIVAVLNGENPSRIATVEHAVKVLQRAFEADPDAISKLVRNRVKCNCALSKDPSIQVAPTGSDGILGGWHVGLLGIINGIFGVDEESWGAIAAKYCDETNTLLGFEDNGRKVVPK